MPGGVKEEESCWVVRRGCTKLVEGWLGVFAGDDVCEFREGVPQWFRECRLRLRHFWSFSSVFVVGGQRDVNEDEQDNPRVYIPVVFSS